MNFITNSALLLVICTTMGVGIQLSGLFPFGPEYNDLEVAAGDDTNLNVPLDTQFQFFDAKYSDVYVNINGVLSFTRDIQSAYNPACASWTTPLIAVFWADVDTTNTGKIYYRKTTDACLLSQFSQSVQVDPPFNPTMLFIVTWYQVTFYGSCEPIETTPINTFQAVLATDGTVSYTSMAYNQITWLAGTAYTGADCHTGLGNGIPFPEVALDNGHGFFAPATPLSCTADALTMESVVPQASPQTPPLPLGLFRAPAPPAQVGILIFRIDSVANFGILLPVDRHTVPAPFFPYGPLNYDFELAHGDDTSEQIALQTQFVMFGVPYNSVVINTDGVLYFGNFIKSQVCSGGNTALIAAYCADADTTTEGAVYYQEINDPAELCRVSRDVWAKFGVPFRPKTLLIVTWVDLPYAGGPPETPGRNTYQIVLASDGSNSYVYLMYRELGWTTGCDTPAPDCGPSSSPPVAGFDPGDGNPPFQLPGSGNSEAVRGILDGSNMGEDGEYLFQVHTAIEEPETRRSSVLKH